MSPTPHRRRVAAAAGAALALVAASAATLAAHDFWLVPNALTFPNGSRVEVLGQSGTKFPMSSGPTQPAQVAEARVVGRSTDQKVTDLAVSGRSLMLRHKPSAAGQYVVAVALAQRDARTTPARLQRYLALEGAPELAARYEQEGRYPKADSITQMSGKYAKTIVEVGNDGPRAFDRAVGHALELVPLDDPARAAPGGTVRVRLLYHGKPVARVPLRAGWGSPAAVSADPASAPAAPEPDQVVETGTDGVAAIQVPTAGWWNVRTLYSASMQGMPEHWEVYFATLVFGVTARGTDDSGDVDAPDATGGPAVAVGAPAVHAPVARAQGASQDSLVLAVVNRFHAALAAGDSTTALGLLSEDVVIMESGGVETKEQYRNGHLNGDMAYAKAVPAARLVTYEHVRGEAAWVASTSVTQGDYNGRPINSAGAELMVLSLEGGRWRIRAVHWSSRARRAG
ncbi:MAG: DUF4198 domain-containing protein [Gemmatimonadota bacterium]|nr:DUF4198 domain-containing protein [Gemmatimonadota bacterium]